jgi:[ribosomal protein S5]-alanine N-acetyltransferase
MKHILETDRLLLREFVQEDFAELFRMNRDKEIMQYVGDGATRNYEEQIDELDRLILNYKKRPGLGIWATLLKESNTFIGGSGLVYYDNTSEIEIGYRMLKEYWNQGYATEASKALLQYGFEQLGLKKIVSSAHTENIASRRVMEKIGLQFKDFRFHYGCRQAYYEMPLEAYIALYK